MQGANLRHVANRVDQHDERDGELREFRFFRDDHEARILIAEDAFELLATARDSKGRGPLGEKPQLPVEGFDLLE